MKAIKKYTAIQLNAQTVNDVVKVDLEFGRVHGPYYDRSEPTKEFDTEEEAIAGAYKQEPYATWLILPIVRFDNSEE